MEGGGAAANIDDPTAAGRQPGRAKKKIFFPFPACSDSPHVVKRKVFLLKKKERNGWDRGLNVSPPQMTRTKAM